MTALAFISGLTLPWLLAAIAAASIPLIIHLVARRRTRRALFPAAALARRAVVGGARARSPRDLSLMLIRGVLLALLVLACAQLARTGTRSTGIGADMIIVLDASASMSRTRAGQPLYEIARERAAKTLRELTPGVDRAAVVVARFQPSPLLPALSTNIEALLAALSRTDATFEHADLAQAIDLALRMPGNESHDAPRRIVVISDAQGLDRVAPHMLAPERSRVTLRAVRLEPDGPEDNVSIDAMRVMGGRFTPGQPRAVEVLARNHASVPRGVHITLSSPDADDADAFVHLKPGEQTWARADMVLPREGFARVTARTAPDSFAPDNTLHALLPVQRPDVLIITDAPDSPATRAVRAAIASILVDADLARIRVLSPSSAQAALIEEASHLVVISPAAFDVEQRDAVVRASALGQRFIAFAFDNSARATLATLTGWGLVESVDATGPATEFLRAPPSFIGDHAVREAAFAIEQTGVRVAPHAQTLEVPESDIALAAAGGPALALSRTSGLQAVCLFFDPSSTEPPLTRSPWFPVLIARLLRIDTPASPLPTVHPGESLSNGHVAREPGFTDLTPRDESRTVAVNLDPRESEAAVTSAVSDDTPRTHQRDQADMSSELDERPVPLWPWLVAAALVFAALESFLLARSGPRRHP